MFTALLKKPITLLLIVGLAIGLVVYKVKSGAPVEHSMQGLPAVSVKVLDLQALPFRPRATAYGHVAPTVFLNAKSEVSGKVIYIHPDLKKGAVVPAGTVVLRIEPTTFELNLNQSESALQASQSSLVQLDVEEKSNSRQLNIAKENLKVGEAEFDRIKSIFDRKLIAKSAVDAEEQKILSLRKQLEEVQGKAAAFQSRRASLQAQIDQSLSQVSQSQDTLGRTEVKLAFVARIGEVSIEQGEFIPAGAVLFEALGMESVEISAELPTSQFGPLIIGMNLQSSIGPGDDAIPNAVAAMNMESTVRLVGWENKASQWQGQLLRIGESIDPTRDTLELLIHVDKPYDNIIPGVKPPLVKGMYTAVEIAAPIQQALIIPRKALHEGRVYVVGDDNKLAIKKVDVAYRQGDLVVLREAQSGLSVGDKIIVSDVIPVIAGLPLLPTVDEEEARALAELALNETADDLLESDGVQK